MALLKSITNPLTGVTATYWRIGPIGIDPVRLTARIMLYGYLNSDIRQLEGGRHVDERAFSVNGPEFVSLVTTPNGGATPFDAVARAAYHHIKTAPRVIPGEPYPWLSEFADAEDV